MADPVVGSAAHQAVGLRHHTHSASRPVPPRRRSSIDGRPVVPIGAAYYIVAVAQRCHWEDIVRRIADLVVGAAAHQAVGLRDYTNGARRAVPPRHRPGVYSRTLIPVGAAHHIVTVAQRCHVPPCDHVVGGTAHQAVGRRHHAHGARRPVSPSGRSSIGDRAVIPVGAHHHIVAIGQRCSAILAD